MNRVISVISVIGFIACLTALIYPVISDRWNRYRDSKLITSYIEAVSGDDEVNEEEFQKAAAYNERLRNENRTIVTDAEYEEDAEYESLLNVNGNGMMGYVEIPCIDVMEPVYHYADDEELAEGIGHIHGSSLPVGGESTHSILTGHRGLPNQKFFSDLDKVKTEDTFYLHVLGHTLAYEVDDIKTVLPSEVDSLLIEKGRDLCTLVTCTPYGVNTHRLLVTGHRVPYSGDVDGSGRVTSEKHRIMLDPATAVFIGFIVFIVLFFVITKVRKRRENRQTSGY